MQNVIGLAWLPTSYSSLCRVCRPKNNWAVCGTDTIYFIRINRINVGSVMRSDHCRSLGKASQASALGPAHIALCGKMGRRCGTRNNM